MTQTADSALTEQSVNGTTSSDEIPLPGPELICRVGGGPEAEPFEWGGQRSVRDLELALGVLERPLASYSRILDFGCGCGRTMRWLRDLAKTTSLYGTDIDERAIEWARENLSFASFEVNAELPPLPYPDGHFDLVYSHSVFTHLDEFHQDRWLEELKRVTAPGGHLVITVHGPHALAKISEDLRRIGEDPEPLRRVLCTEGILFLKDDAFVGGPFPDSYHTTVHAPWYLLDRWGELLTVKGYLPQRSLDFQDIIILENDPNGVKPSLSRLNASESVRLPQLNVVLQKLASTTSRLRMSYARIQDKLGTSTTSVKNKCASDERLPSPNQVVFNETTQRTILRNIGERINRLEKDMLEMIDAHDQRITELSQRLSEDTGIRDSST